MNNYYLIARDINTNKFKIIELKSKWYLKNGTDYTFRSNSLEVIDLITTRFSSREGMAKRLCSRGYIDHCDYDFFIVNKYKRNGVNKIKYHEVIYNIDNRRNDLIRNIAYNSLNKNVKCKENMILLDEFLNTLHLSAAYSRIVNNEITGLSKKLVDTVSYVHIQDNVPYNLKYRNPWMMESYGISRNIVDSLNKYQEFSMDDDAFKSYINYYNGIIKDRRNIENELIRVCDKDYNPLQTSLFDTKEELIEAELPESDISKPLDIEDKKRHVMYYLTNLGVSAFKRDDRNRIYIDLDDFLDQFDVKDYRILKNNLNSSIIKNAYLYNLHNSKLKICEQSFGDVSILEEDLRDDYKDLSNCLKSDSIIDKAYEFCITYEDVCRKNLKKNKCKIKKTD